MAKGDLTITLDERELRELNRRLSELSKTEQRTTNHSAVSRSGAFRFR